MEVTNLPVTDLYLRSDARQPLAAHVDELKKSIAALGGRKEGRGLIHPVRVRKVSDCSFEIIGGGHRVAACRQLGWKTVPCHVVDDDDMHAELASIDENLIRSRLGPGALALALAKRKEIYEALHPDTKKGRSQAHGMNAKIGNNVSAKMAPTFAEDTAAATGKSKRTVYRELEPNKHIDPEALALLANTPLDLPEFLSILREMDREHQAVYVRGVLKMVGDGGDAADSFLAAIRNDGPPPPIKNPIIRAYKKASQPQRDEFFAQLGNELSWPATPAP